MKRDSSLSRFFLSDYLLTGNKFFYRYASLNGVFSAGQKALLL